jgi:PKHD-type hydroxylase
MNNTVHYSYWKWDGVLSKEFCRSALEQIDWAISEPGTVGRDGSDDFFVVDVSKRRTDIIWQDAMQPLGCIAKAYINAANQAAGWNYGLSVQDNTQIGRYKSTDEGCYDWHTDAGIPENGIQRKLSISILLADPSEFEGGELQFKGIEDHKILTKQGSIVVFPSFIEHKVTPVTKGVRYSAVTWASGPSFR